MESLVRLIVNTLIRGGIYRSMRHLDARTALVLTAAAAAVLLLVIR